MWNNSEEMINLQKKLEKIYYCSLGTEIHRNELGRPTTEYIWIYGLTAPQVAIRLYRQNNYVFAKTDSGETLDIPIGNTEKIIERLSEIIEKDKPTITT